MIVVDLMRLLYDRGGKLPASLSASGGKAGPGGHQLSVNEASARADKVNRQ